MSNLEYVPAPYPTLPPIYENDNGRIWRSRSTPLLMTLHGQQAVLEKKRSQHTRGNVCQFPVRLHAECAFDVSTQQQVSQVMQVSEIQPLAIFEAKPEPLINYQPNLEQQIAQHKLTEQNLRQTISVLKSVNQELKYLVHIDALTQVSNRRCFDESLHREWQRSLREQQTLSLVLLDIDFFKGYNDAYGHPEGDRCLTSIAQAIKSVLQRPTDLLARYGGEEFVIILPNTTEDGAVKVIQLIQKTIADLSIVHGNSAVSDVVTASFGLAAIVPSEDLSPSFLLEHTDRALYQAKQQGRDRYAIYMS